MQFRRSYGSAATKSGHKDRHYVKVKSYSEHSKPCKSVKNWKSEIFTIPALSFYVEYRKK